MKCNAKPTDVVVDFISKFSPTKNHIFFCNSYYGSLDLAQALHEKSYNFVLSAKSNRPTWLFKECLHKGLKKGTIINK